MRNSISFKQIQALTGDLRQLADSLESESAFLTTDNFSDLSANLSKEIHGCRVLLSQSAEKRIEAFGELLPDWLGAWTAKKAKLNKLCKSKLGYDLPAKIAAKEATWLKRRLLADLLQQEDVAGVRELLAKTDETPAAKTKKPPNTRSLIEQPEINRALKTWGELSQGRISRGI
jgi:hypothetical protein